MKKKVYIIQPSFRKMDGKLVKGFTLGSCPLDLPLLSATIPSDWEKDCTHEYFDEINYSTDASVVFITSTSNDILHARDIALQFRKRGKYVLFGGHEDDFSEDILKEVCHSYYRGVPDTKDMRKILIDAEADNLKPCYHLDQNLDYPFDYSIYQGKKIRFLHVQASSGCLFKCEYCRHPYASNGGTYRLRDIDCIIEDLRSIRKITKYAAFKDPNFYNNRDHLIRLCKRIVNEKIKIHWGAQMPPYIGNDEEALHLMRKAGCKVIYIGFETLNRDNLKSVRKHFDPDKYLPMVKNIQKAGIRVVGYFMFGFDHDTEESFEQVYDFVQRSKIAYPLINILTPIPGTPVFDRMKAEGRLDYPDIDTFKRNNPLYSIPNSKVYFEPKNISRKELEANFMKLAKRLTSFKEIFRRSFRQFDLQTWIVLKMNLSFRKDRQRLEAYSGG